MWFSYFISKQEDEEFKGETSKGFFMISQAILKPTKCCNTTKLTSFV